MKHKTLVIVGSIRDGSMNRRLAEALVRLSADRFAFSWLAIADLPMFDQDLEGDLPEPVRRMKGAIVAADALLFVTPEYNRSIPPLLKNAIDWGCRHYGESVWTGKPAAVAGASPDGTGTAPAQYHLRTVLTSLQIPVMPFPEAIVEFDEALIAPGGDIRREAVRKHLEHFMARFARWTAALSAPD